MTSSIVGAADVEEEVEFGGCQRDYIKHMVGCGMWDDKVRGYVIGQSPHLSSHSPNTAFFCLYLNIERRPFLNLAS